MRVTGRPPGKPIPAAHGGVTVADEDVVLLPLPIFELPLQISG